MIRVAAVLLLLASCSAPAFDRAAIDINTQRIEPRVVRDCRVVKVAGAIATLASIVVPGVGIMDVVIDRACDDPEMTARAIAAGEQIAERLQDQR